MAVFPLHLVPANTHIRFLESKWLAFGLSVLAMLATVFLLATKGLNFGIDFTGGTVIELRTEQPVPLQTYRETLGDLQLGEIALQNIGSDKDVMIRLQAFGTGEEQALAVEQVKNTLEGALNTAIDYRKVDVVGPVVGEELIQAGSLSLGLALIGIMIYIWIRFEWQFGLCAIAALFHDLLLTLGLYSLLQLEFNLTSIAAILTIIGYSINDSVVIFDRIRENLRKYKQEALESLLNRSINNTLSRTILTAGTTMAALLALVLLGGEVIYGFSVAVLFGVVIGTYSSIYIAAPLLIFMKLRES